MSNLFLSPLLSVIDVKTSIIKFADCWYDVMAALFQMTIVNFRKFSDLTIQSELIVDSTVNFCFNCQPLKSSNFTIDLMYKLLSIREARTKIVLIAYIVWAFHVKSVSHSSVSKHRHKQTAKRKITVLSYYHCELWVVVEQKWSKNHVSE